MHIVRPALALLLAVAFIIVLNTKFSIMPPIGKFFDPFHGFWQNAEYHSSTDRQILDFGDLHTSVQILYDDRRIPHVFAENDHDLFFAQGFVTARDRLWQMEFQTHAAAGRLSEIMGSASLGAITTIDFDLHQRRVGMTFGARNALQAMQADPSTSTIVQAYSKGINAYIHSLEPKDYPVEYKILDYAPELWTPLKCALLLKHMAWRLTGRSSDLQMSNTLAQIGPEAMADLFPHYPKKMEPVVPEETKWQFKAKPLLKPGKEFRPKTGNQRLPIEPHPANGSNNWAVSGKKTASGFPILSNDPHLSLNLPSIWYEIQLNAPGVNVYGASLPGAPNVIVGFNERAAWGVTNSEADVMDWYEIQFKDASLAEYRHDAQWKKTRRLIEHIKIRGGATISDTIIFTHHGPIALRPTEKSINRQIPALHALRWLGHDIGNEARTFYELNRAQNYEDYVAALRHYGCPAQNFVFADQNNDIAIWHNGRFPAKWQGQGKFISDGSDPAYDWQGWIPHEQNPHTKNPRHGFVSSANQNATGPDYPYYLNWYFAPYYRGARINEWLRTSDNIRPDDFRIMQLDTKNLLAESVLPGILKALASIQQDETSTMALRELRSWDFFNDAYKIAPTVFSVWWEKLHTAIWRDEFGAGYVRLPHKDRTAELLINEPDAKWYDNANTVKKETRAHILQATFKAACDELRGKLGEPGEAWQWGKYKGTDIMHIARLPGFSHTDLDVGGGFSIVNATAERHGPSWRMVVSLGPAVEGWAIYPGGQSGNPGSIHYDDFIDEWTTGELAELVFLKSKNEMHPRITNKLVLRRP